MFTIFPYYTWRYSVCMRYWVACWPSASFTVSFNDLSWGHLQTSPVELILLALSSSFFTQFVLTHVLFNTPFAYLFWLANKRRQISRVLFELLWRIDILVVADTSITHMSIIINCTYLIPPLHIITKKTNSKTHMHVNTECSEHISENCEIVFFSLNWKRKILQVSKRVKA